MCTLPSIGLANPECGDLARTYAEAVLTAPDSFYLVVIRQGEDSPRCQGIYSTDGTLLETPDL